MGKGSQHKHSLSGVNTVHVNLHMVLVSTMYCNIGGHFSAYNIEPRC